MSHKKSKPKKKAVAKRIANPLQKGEWLKVRAIRKRKTKSGKTVYDVRV